MDLLGGYGGSDGSDSEPETAPCPSPSTVRTSAPTTAPSTAPSAAAGEEGSSAGSNWSKVPAPKVAATAVKRVVQYKLPIQQALLAAGSDSEEEEEEAERRAKRAKANSGAKSKLLDFLPKPKNDAGGALGGGFEGGAARRALGGGGGSRSSALPSSDPFATSERPSSEALAPASNEAYRAAPEADMHPAMAYMADAGPSCPEAAHHGGSYSGYEQPGASYCQGYDAGPVYGAAMPPTGSAAGAMQHMHAQQQKKQPVGNAIDLALQGELANVQFKEINQKELTYVDPSRAETQQGMRQALGADFAQSLRSEAKGFEGSKLAKRKHQIGTLFHNAKMKELEILEGKVASSKSKRETQAKYGWS